MRNSRHSMASLVPPPRSKAASHRHTDARATASERDTYRSLTPGGQPRVGWHAVVRDRISAKPSEISGHIEVRWSHGRFGGLPEAKGYLDTPHHLVPGYFPLR